MKIVRKNNIQYTSLQPKVYRIKNSKRKQFPALTMRTSWKNRF